MTLIEHMNLIIGAWSGTSNNVLLNFRIKT